MKEGYMYKTSEVAEKLRVHESTVRRWIKEGSLRAARFGRTYRVHESDLQAFFDEAMQEGTEKIKRESMEK